jgi:hypothetical protein
MLTFSYIKKKKKTKLVAGKFQSPMLEEHKPTTRALIPIDMHL